MSGYCIYCLVITAAYLIYMTVVIAMDLNGKKGAKKPEAEEFLTGEESSQEEETTAVVEETEGGYRIGGPNEVVPETDEAETQEEDPDEDKRVFDENDESDINDENEVNNSDYEGMEEVHSEMDSTPKIIQGQMSCAEFSQIACCPMTDECQIERNFVPEANL